MIWFEFYGYCWWFNVGFDHVVLPVLIDLLFVLICVGLLLGGSFWVAADLNSDVVLVV